MSGDGVQGAYIPTPTVELLSLTVKELIARVETLERQVWVLQARVPGGAK